MKTMMKILHLLSFLSLFLQQHELVVVVRASYVIPSATTKKQQIHHQRFCLSSSVAPSLLGGGWGLNNKNKQHKIGRGGSSTIEGRGTKKRTRERSNIFPASSSSSTALYALLDVDPPYFQVLLPVLGITLSISKRINRARREERAWEQRLAEARANSLSKQNPTTLTELEIRSRQAAMEWSAYGPRSNDDDDDEEYEAEGKRGRRRRRGGVQVMEREEDDDDDKDQSRRVVGAGARMTDEEIDAFELEYGIEYDPYYDEPYTEDELPDGDGIRYHVDRKYGDRIYEDGEIFYKDAKTGLYYRQGCKPRGDGFSFWN